MYLPRINEEPKKTESTVLDDSSTSAYRDVRYLFFIVLVAFFGMCFFQLFASIPQYFSEVCKYHEDTIGLLLGLNGLLVVIIEMPLVARLEKNRKIFSFIIAGVLCLPVSFAILYFGKGMMIWAVVYTLFITLSEILAMPFMMNFSLSRSAKERQGQYSALYSIAYGLANIFAPLLGLGIADKYGFDKMFYFFIGLSMLTAIGFWILKRKEASKK